MNVIIPVAGIGKRLRPHTYSTPKCLLMVAGKPIVGHILDKLKDVKLNKVILIVGYMRNKIREYVSKNYSFSISYIEQEEQLGLGHAVWMTKDIAKNDSCLIIYGDTIFEGDILFDMEVDGCIGVRSVADPRRLGVVELTDGFISKFVEKPAQPRSNLAILGVNFIKNSIALFDTLDDIISENRRTANELQLTDAFELMVERGAKFKPFTLDGWYDCGTLESTLWANRELLAKQKIEAREQKGNSVIILPVFIHKLAKVEHSIIGPNVSIDRDVYIKNSMIFDSIINEGAVVEDSRIEHSIIGSNAIVKGISGKINIGDFSVVHRGE